ncbi:putative 4-hydroxybenzoate polyprenyltransferase [bacterium]|nr:putative 4-hydroxybenzoate polyprenyltransferase [bacterium]
MSLFRKTATFLEMIKFSHSVFALPFALIAMLVAAQGWPSFGTFVLIIIAAVSARTAAMCFNRIVDREIDSRNPRTRGRALVTGELSMAFAWTALIVAIVVFYAAAAALNWLCLALATPCLAVLLGYSLTKRWTQYAHFVLGAALGLAPLGAWIAVRGSIGLFPILLGIAVLLWVAGFDILYACQDFETDKREGGLHSIPKRYGLAGAMAYARRVHVGAVVMFLLAWLAGSPPLGVLFLLGILGVTLLIRHQHSIVSPRDLSRINAAFFTANGLISIGLFLVAWLDV